MAIPSTKVTYTLDTPTLRVLERIAARWGVSKSEAVRRAIRAAGTATPDDNEPTSSLDRLQRAAGVSAAAATAWVRKARAERRSNSR